MSGLRNCTSLVYRWAGIFLPVPREFGLKDEEIRPWEILLVFTCIFIFYNLPFQIYVVVYYAPREDIYLCGHVNVLIVLRVLGNDIFIWIQNRSTQTGY